VTSIAALHGNVNFSSGDVLSALTTSIAALQTPIAALAMSILWLATAYDRPSLPYCQST
jgi:hypothetical protein